MYLSRFFQLLPQRFVLDPDLLVEAFRHRAVREALHFLKQLLGFEVPLFIAWVLSKLLSLKKILAIAALDVDKGTGKAKMILESSNIFKDYLAVPARPIALTII